MHVASPPDTHEVWPAVQLLVQVKEHAAFGATPEHDVGLAQVDVETT
jgi:hypothetical protein